jgi:hypothetical protein
MFPAHFLKDPVCKALETEDVNVHDAPPGVHHHQILLRLHGKLFRHEDQKLFFRRFRRFLDDFFKYVVGFSRSGISQNQL